MNGSERDVHVEERANRILGNERAAAAFATFVEAQFRCRAMRAGLLAGLRKLAITAMAFVAAGTASGPSVSPPPSAESAR